MPSPDLSFLFGLKPEEAIAWFEAKNKNFTTGWDWREVWREKQAQAFTVAKVMKTDILQDIHSSLQQAMASGETFEKWQRKLEPTLKTKGWWGEVVNKATGEIATVGPWRLRTIFDTNVQTALNVGHYQTNLANADNRPWWRYVAVRDNRTRPAHAALNGLVFRYDDPFWDSHHPQNGFRCRCLVQTLDAAGLDERQQRGDVAVRSTVGPKATATMDEVEMATGNDGAMTKVRTVKTTGLHGQPVSMAPDPGWDYNPGKSWARIDKNGMLPDCGTLDFAVGSGKGCISPVGNQPTWRTLGRPDLRSVPAHDRHVAPSMLPAAATREGAVTVMADALGISAEKPLLLVTTPIEVVPIRYEWLPHLVVKAVDARERYANFILPTLRNPYEIWAPLYDDGTIRERYIGLFTGDKDFMVVVRVNKDGSMMWNVMQAESKKMNPHRMGGLIFPK